MTKAAKTRQDAEQRPAGGGYTPASRTDRATPLGVTRPAAARSAARVCLRREPRTQREIEVRKGPPLTAAQHERLVRLLATGLERYLRPERPREPTLDFLANLCVHDDHARESGAFGG